MAILSDEFSLVADSFNDYRQKHEHVRDEVQGFVTRATELAESADWKRKIAGKQFNFGDCAFAVDGGSLAVLDAEGRYTKYPCSKIHESGSPDQLCDFRDMEQPGFDALGGVIGYAAGIAAPIAFMAGGPAGYLALGSVAGFAAMVVGWAVGDVYEALQRDFMNFRRELEVCTPCSTSKWLLSRASSRR